jgi:DUF971 family protein
LGTISENAAMSALGSQHPAPVALGRDAEDRLFINWSDGHRSIYSWKYLRANCPCAGCRDERAMPPDPFRILSPADLAPKPPLAALSMPRVGHYAYKIVWNDGHDTGLYTLETLRALCQCPQCSNK